MGVVACKLAVVPGNRKKLGSCWAKHKNTFRVFGRLASYELIKQQIGTTLPWGLGKGHPFVECLEFMLQSYWLTFVSAKCI